RGRQGKCRADRAAGRDAWRHEIQHCSRRRQCEPQQDIGDSGKRALATCPVRRCQMTAKIIDGKAFSEDLRARVAAETARLKAEHNLVPGLATVLVGNDPASEVYVRNKGKVAEKLGLRSFHYALPENASEAEVLARVRALNDDPDVHGILVQMPLPKQV